MSVGENQDQVVCDHMFFVCPFAVICEKKPSTTEWDIQAAVLLI